MCALSEKPSTQGRSENTMQTKLWHKQIMAFIAITMDYQILPITVCRNEITLNKWQQRKVEEPTIINVALLAVCKVIDTRRVSLLSQTLGRQTDTRVNHILVEEKEKDELKKFGRRPRSSLGLVDDHSRVLSSNLPVTTPYWFPLGIISIDEALFHWRLAAEIASLKLLFLSVRQRERNKKGRDAGNHH